MPRRMRADQGQILEVFVQTGNGRETARILGLHENTVYAAIKRAKGLCLRCGTPVNPGETNCVDCRTQGAEWRKQQRKERQRRGVCAECDNPVEAPSPVYCAAHRDTAIRRRATSEGRTRQALTDGERAERQRLRNVRTSYGEAGVLVVQRDGDTCVLCGGTRKESRICVHHIDEDPNNSAVENMVCLCHDCHKLVHLLAAHPDLKRVRQWMRQHHIGIML